MADGQNTLRDMALALVETWKIEPARAEADVLSLASQLIERGALVGLETA
jgi:hypothetical protein